MQRLLLFGIILVYLATAVLFAVNTPKWQAPDEPAHFNYIRAIAETGTLPVLQSGDYNQTYLDQIKAEKFPASMPIDPIRYEAYQPPLYYLVATPIYLIARALGWNGVIALRLFSILLGLLVLLVAHNIVREIFPDDGLLALATVGLMATIPQHIAVSASISNDLAAELIVGLILWLALRRAKNIITNRRFVLLGGILFGAGLLTKSTTYVPAIALLVAAEIARANITQIRFSLFTLRSLFHLVIVAALVAAPMFIRNVLTYGATDPLGIARHDAIVIGQPTTAEMIARLGLNHVVFDYLAITFKSFWAQFGWMGVLVNDRIYVALFALTAAAIVGLGLYKLRMLRHGELLTRAQWWGLGLLSLLLAVAVFDYVAYNFKFFQLQGRYLFPALVAIAFALVVGLRELLAREHERLVFAALYFAFVAFDLASLFLFIIPQLKS